MALSLAVIDLADNTGATATVSGTSGGAWTIWTQPAGTLGFSQAASGTGDGTALLPTLGVFFAYCILATGGPSAIVAYAATVSPTACVVRCQQAIVAVLQAKTFAAPPGGRSPPILAQKAANVLQTNLPAIVVTLEGLAEEPADDVWDSEGNDLCGYRVGVLIVAHTSRLYQDAPLYLKWRETAKLALQNRSAAGDVLANVPELLRARIEVGPQIEDELTRALLPDYQGLGSGFVVNCACIQQRG